MTNSKIMKPNKKLSKKTLTVNEKNTIYSALKSPYEKKMKDYDKSLEGFIVELIEKYIFPEGSDLKYLSGKYYSNSGGRSSCVHIGGKSFGLDDVYNPNKDTPGYVPVNIGMSVYIPSGYPIKRNDDETVGNDLKEYVPSELIDILKDRLIEFSEIVYECRNFGVGKIFHSTGRSRPFDEIKTWGQLYRLSEEWYSLAYELMSDRLPDEYKIPDTPDPSKGLELELQLQALSKSLLEE